MKLKLWLATECDEETCYGIFGSHNDVEMGKVLLEFGNGVRHNNVLQHLGQSCCPTQMPIVHLLRHIAENFLEGAA